MKILNKSECANIQHFLIYFHVMGRKKFRNNVAERKGRFLLICGYTWLVAVKLMTNQTIVYPEKIFRIIFKAGEKFSTGKSPVDFYPTSLAWNKSHQHKANNKANIFRTWQLHTHEVWKANTFSAFAVSNNRKSFEQWLRYKNMSDDEISSIFLCSVFKNAKFKVHNLIPLIPPAVFLNHTFPLNWLLLSFHHVIMLFPSKNTPPSSIFSTAEKHPVPPADVMRWWGRKSVEEIVHCSLTLDVFWQTLSKFSSHK